MRREKIRRATAFAPATVANVAVGFDILGFPIHSVGDTVTVTRIPEPGRVEIESLQGDPAIPTEPSRNTATACLIRFCEERELKHGFRVAIKKGIPIGSGMGGSAASAVASIVAANAVTDRPLTTEKLMPYALEGEAVASGSKHADNVAPCLLGGLVLSQSVEPFEYVRIKSPTQLVCVLVHPDIRVDTQRARAILRDTVSLKEHVKQSANLAAFIAGCLMKDIKIMQRSLHDVLIEPQRAHLIPGFHSVQDAAIREGALGCSISGSGPSVFALVANRAKALKVRRAMLKAFANSGVNSLQSWVSPIQSKGAFIA